MMTSGRNRQRRGKVSYGRWTYRTSFTFVGGTFQWVRIIRLRCTTTFRRPHCTGHDRFGSTGVETYTQSSPTRDCRASNSGSLYGGMKLTSSATREVVMQQPVG